MHSLDVKLFSVLVCVLLGFIVGGGCVSTDVTGFVSITTFTAASVVLSFSESAAMLCGENTITVLPIVVVKSRKQAMNRVLSFKLIVVNTKMGRVEMESKSYKLTPEMKATLRSAGEAVL